MYICPDARDWLTLCFLPGVGCALMNRLVDGLGGAPAVLTAGDDVARLPGIGPAVTRLFTSTKALTEAREKAGRELQTVKDSSISLISRDCSLYPPSLAAIADPPVLLYAKGNLDCLKSRCVAVVGSRAATTYGQRMAQGFARGLASAGCTVVSGLAYGIDAQAHDGALAAGGKTIAVLGCGIDVVYPAAHRQLYERIHQQGTLISEYPLGSRPEGFRFPVRNRIISGLSAGVVVVEAAIKSGSLITARLALDQGREVFAVPGRIDSLRSAGCHRLVQQGAFLAHSVDDVLHELGFSGQLPATDEETRPGAEEPLSAEAEQLLQLLDVYPLGIDLLLNQSGLEASVLYDLLLDLELKGHIRQLPSQQYQLVRKV